MRISAHIRRIFYSPQIGCDAVYSDGTTTTDVRAILDRQAEIMEGEAVFRADVVSLLLAQVPDPGPGDTVTIGPNIWALVNRHFDDGDETRWSARIIGQVTP